MYVAYHLNKRMLSFTIYDTQSHTLQCIWGYGTKTSWQHWSGAILTEAQKIQELRRKEKMLLSGE